jgi:hypothetical protein
MPAQCRTSIRPTVTISWPSGPQRRPAERLLGPGRLAQPMAEKGGQAGTCQPGAAGTSGGAAARQCWRCRVSGTRTEGDPSARQMWRGGWTLTEAAHRRWGGGGGEMALVKSESPGRLQGVTEVRVRPQFENGWRGILAHRAMAVMPASNPAGTLAVGAQDWTTGSRMKGEAMAHSDVGEKEAERKESEVDGRRLFKAEVG